MVAGWEEEGKYDKYIHLKCMFNEQLSISVKVSVVIPVNFEFWGVFAILKKLLASADFWDIRVQENEFQDFGYLGNRIWRVSFLKSNFRKLTLAR